IRFCNKNYKVFTFSGNLSKSLISVLLPKEPLSRLNSRNKREASEAGLPKPHCRAASAGLVPSAHGAQRPPRATRRSVFSLVPLVSQFIFSWQKVHSVLAPFAS